MKNLLWLLVLGCATAPRGELYERSRSDAARVQVIELGWNAVEDPGVINHPPVVDLERPRRYKGLVLEEAQDLAAQCNAGHPSFDTLLRKSPNEGPSEPVTVEPGSRFAYRDAALRLRAGECAVVEGPVSDFVVKRLE
jgi:hypothetical protein